MTQEDKEPIDMKHVMLREIPKAREAFGEAIGGSEDWFIAEACEKVVMDHVSTLKKRIAELEKDKIEWFNEGIEAAIQYISHIIEIAPWADDYRNEIEKLKKPI